MRKYKGYMTLEATLVIPKVICALTLLILFSYYLYGRCILSQDCYVLALRSSIDADRYGIAPENTILAKKDRVLGKKYFGSTKPVFHVESKDAGKEIRVDASAKIRAGVMGNYFLKPRSGWEFRAGHRAKCLGQVKHIRKMTRLKDIGNRVFD